MISWRDYIMKNQEVTKVRQIYVCKGEETKNELLNEFNRKENCK